MCGAERTCRARVNTDTQTFAPAEGLYALTKTSLKSVNAILWQCVSLLSRCGSGHSSGPLPAPRAPAHRPCFLEPMGVSSLSTPTLTPVSPPARSWESTPEESLCRLASNFSLYKHLNAKDIATASIYDNRNDGHLRPS